MRRTTQRRFGRIDAGGGGNREIGTPTPLRNPRTEERFISAARADHWRPRNGRRCRQAAPPVAPNVRSDSKVAAAAICLASRVYSDQTRFSIRGGCSPLAEHLPRSARWRLRSATIVCASVTELPEIDGACRSGRASRSTANGSAVSPAHGWRITVAPVKSITVATPLHNRHRSSELRAACASSHARALTERSAV